MIDNPQIIEAPIKFENVHSDAFGKAWSRLYKFIRSRVSTHEDAEDLLQDVLYKMFESYDANEPIEQISAWLFAVARNKITDWYRKRRASSSLESGIEDDEFVESHAASADPRDHADHGMNREEFWRVFTEAIDQLPANQRDVFIKHEIEGMSFKEIAEETDEPMSVLLSRKHYAVKKLRKLLGAYESGAN